MLLFIVCILTELFLYCYFGNRLAEEVRATEEGDRESAKGTMTMASVAERARAGGAVRVRLGAVAARGAARAASAASGARAGSAAAAHRRRRRRAAVARHLHQGEQTTVTISCDLALHLIAHTFLL